MKKMRMLLVFSVVSAMFLSSCSGSRPVPIPEFGEITSLKGKTSEEMNERFGMPDRRYSAENDLLVSEYRWPSESKKGMNAMMSFGTFGISNGSDSAYVDMLRCWFFKEIVKRCERLDEMMNINIPGASGLLGDQTQGATPPEQTQVEQAKPALVAEIRPEPIAIAPAAPVAKIASKKQVTPSLTDETITSSKNFKDKNVKTVIAKILAGAENNGMNVTKKEKTSVVLLTADGAKILVSLKQVKKDVLVELKTTGDPNMSTDFQSIYATCK